MPGSGPISRRSFLESGATAGAVTLVARHVLGGPKYVPPSDRINVGYVGKILAEFSGRHPRLIPKARMEMFKAPPKTLPRPAEELDQWVRACRGEAPPKSCDSVELQALGHHRHFVCGRVSVEAQLRPRR